MAAVQFFGLLITIIVGSVLAPDEEDDKDPGSKVDRDAVLTALLILCACCLAGTALIFRGVYTKDSRRGQAARPSDADDVVLMTAVENTGSGVQMSLVEGSDARGRLDDAWHSSEVDRGTPMEAI